MYGSDSIKIAWNELRSIIQHAIQLFTPKIRLYSHQFLKWFTPEIRHQVTVLRTLRSRCKTRPTTLQLSKLRIAEVQLSTDIHLAKQKLEENLVDDLATNSSCQVYKFLRSLSKSNCLPTVIRDPNTSYTGSDEPSKTNLTPTFTQYSSRARVPQRSS